MKEEMKLKEAQERAVAEHGELALIAVEGPKAETNERIALRPPMLQVITDNPSILYKPLGNVGLASGFPTLW